MQLSYSWLNSFVKENQECTMDENDFEIPFYILNHAQWISLRLRLVLRGR